MGRRDRTRGGQRRSLFTADGIRIRAEYLPGTGADRCALVVHGFSGGIAQERNVRVVNRLARRLPVVAIDLRGHGGSSGESTLGDKEVLDVSAAVDWAHVLGFDAVITVGFSLGAGIVVRHAGVMGGIQGVVAVSTPAFWGYRGTAVMRRLHFGVEHPAGRIFVRRVMRTRVVPPPWPDPWPMSPVEAARYIAPIPLLLVHGTRDPFFPEEHPRALHLEARAGARDRGHDDHVNELWLEDMGHAEEAVTDGVLDRIAEWAANRS